MFYKQAKDIHTYSKITLIKKHSHRQYSTFKTHNKTCIIIFSASDYFLTLSLRLTNEKKKWQTKRSSTHKKETKSRKKKYIESIKTQSTW